MKIRLLDHHLNSQIPKLAVRCEANIDHGHIVAAGPFADLSCPFLRTTATKEALEDFLLEQGAAPESSFNPCGRGAAPLRGGGVRRHIRFGPFRVARRR